MSRHINIFKSTTGINNKIDPVRLRFDYRTGVSDLAAGVNIDCDDTGRPSRRVGYTATDRTGSWHSLFGSGAHGFGVTGDALCVIEPNMGYTSLRNVTVGARMSYVRDTDGEQDVVYYANGHETGRIIDKTSYSWPLKSPVGPESSIKSLSAAPTGHLLCVRNSRMFIAQDNFLFYSEPNTYHAYRLGTNFFGFPSRLKMVMAVDGGLWISDSESIYFLSGNIAPTLQEMPIQKKRADFPAVEGTAVEAPASRIGLDRISGIVTIFTTTKGVCIGSVDGNLIPITEHKIDLPHSLTGAGFYSDGKYKVTLD